MPVPQGVSAAKLIKGTKAAGTKVIAIEPHHSKTVQMANLWLPPRPGRDGT